MGIERYRRSLRTLNKPARDRGDGAEAAGVRTRRTGQDRAQGTLDQGLDAEYLIVHFDRNGRYSHVGVHVD